MKIAVVGAGYVGLTAGACLSDFGHDVSVAESDTIKLERLRRGDVSFFEPGLQDLVRHNALAGRLHFREAAREVAAGAEVVLVCVGTPADEDGRADLRQVIAAVAEVGAAELARGVVVALRSTVPVGTTDRARSILREASGHDVSTCFNPEFMKEGEAVRDFARPDRVVVGVVGDDNHARSVMGRLYAPHVRTDGRVLYMSARSAELVKYASNAMLATRISMMCEVANLCDVVGASVDDVRRGVGADARIGDAFLYAGVGWGGSCFEKDVRALLGMAQDVGAPTPLVAEAALLANRRQRRLFSAAIRGLGGVDGDLRGRVVAVWGLAFKPGTSDVRGAPSLDVILDLVAAGARVRADDPEAPHPARAALGARAPLVDFVDDPYEAAAGAHALALVTEWRALRNPDFARLRRVMAGSSPTLFDGRNVWNVAAARAAGLAYRGVGRGEAAR